MLFTLLGTRLDHVGQFKNFIINLDPANILSEFIRDATCFVLHGLYVFGLLFFVLFWSSFLLENGIRTVRCETLLRYM